ncbi:MocR-like pyridoxine biosynthesis transcription factor PdxR [Bacillus sp. AK128]
MNEITPVLDHSKPEPLYLQLYTYIKQEIHHGRIKPGMKLPSKRKLSNHLSISQHTVETTYMQLLAEGYIESKPRVGLFVVELEEHLSSNIQGDVFPNSRNREERLDEYSVEFSHGKIAVEYFPYTTWRKLTVESLYEEQSQLLSSGDDQGEYVLREEIKKYLYQSRGVSCSADQIIIGAGTQYLISLMTLIIGRDATYSMEDPGFHRTREVFKDQGVDLKPIPLDSNGLDINKLVESKATITYVTPSHQFPTGIIMPITRRMELLKWAQENKGYIIEDDYDGEFRYKGKPIPSLQGLDHHNRVVYLGTFSKSLIPSIRISYAVLPNDLLTRYHEHFSIYKQTVSRFHQQTLYYFMKKGHWESHLNRMRTIYRRRQKAILTNIEENFGNKIKIIGEDSGLHFLVQINNNMSEDELIQSAKEFKVKVFPTSIYYHELKGDMSPRILMGFGGLSEEKIKEGIQLLKRAWCLNGEKNSNSNEDLN